MSSYRLGIDIGSTTSKAALIDADDKIIKSKIIPTSHDGKKAAETLRDEILADVSEPENIPTLATGYGRALVDFASKTVTEITCHAKGVFALCNEARTIIDIGGQDAKAIRIDSCGNVEDFAMNDRCAAGTGYFLDTIARKFDRTLDELSEIHSLNPTPLEISSTCVVFAESEVIGLLSKGNSAEDIIAGVHRAIARRVATLAKQVKPVAPLAFSGGVARNETMRRELEAALEMPVLKLECPQLTAAYGAALLAK